MLSCEVCSALIVDFSEKMAVAETVTLLSREVGESIPPNTAHVSLASLCQNRTFLTDYEKAVSVSLPTWKANVGYEEGEDWVLSKMKTGYPRSVSHSVLQTHCSDKYTTVSSYIKPSKPSQVPL